ncbi:calmegin precursor [Daubentonia madagascariensis]|uniref:Calmegin n=1 Tax=Daubentonia madagascariensis TaxID=31869 RepID=A0ABD2EPI5_DAUMA
MHFQGFSLCLGLLFISINAEFMDDGVEMEDFDENSEEIDVNEGELPSEMKYKTPTPIGEVYFTETFDSGRLAGWVLSNAKKDDIDAEISIYDGRWEIEELKENRVPGDRGLVLKSRAKHHAISAVLAKPFIFADKPLIVQDESEPAEIEDLGVVKPDGWLDDEPKFIPDPNAEKPDDWNEDMDGEWEAPRIPNPACRIGCGEWKPPMIDNPKYKGVWRPPMIDNPNYQGIWSPRKIPNPDYFEDDHPFLLTSFRALGLELWSMTSNIYFDNFIICSEKEVADRWATDGWRWKIMIASANEPGIFKQLMAAAQGRPWLWLVYLVTAGLPIALITSFCWPRKVKKKYEDTEYKKTDICKPQTKGALEQEVKEEKAALEKPIDLEEEKKQSDAEILEKEEEGEPEEKSEEEIEIIEGQEEGNKSNKSGSEDEMKEADESTGSGDGPIKSVRKRRVRKD